MLQNLKNWTVITACAVICVSMDVPAAAQTKKTKEPVFRVAKNSQPKKGGQATTNESNKIKATAASAKKEIKPHPLTAAIEIAESGMKQIKSELFDYTGIMVKRERISGVLQDKEFIKFKIRNEREVNGESVPFSIYMRFLGPANKRGQEVIWVRGQNKGKLIAHAKPDTLIGKITVRLDPDSNMAMDGNKYPIYDAGLENLVKKLLEKATRDRDAGDCIVNFHQNATINKRPCTMFELIHPVRKSPYEFYKAKVYIDKELNLPVRYAAYDWPTEKGAKPKLLEEYTYVQIKTNVGLTDEDFNHKNSDYDYAR